MREISLTQGKIALVDDVDYPRLSEHKWHAHHMGGRWGAKSHVGHGRYIYMHRFILDAQPGQMVDHKNHDGLDNRRQNIRLCTAQQNSANNRRVYSASGYKGVYRHPETTKWEAKITVNRHPVHIGFFRLPEDAARAYDVAARAAFGEFAKTNEDLGLL